MKRIFFFEWWLFEFNSLNIKILIYLDWISLIFIFTVILISSIIIFYRREYMIHDCRNSRFFYLVLIFVISILLIILSPNIIRILIGWDGLGLISYCLVIYYHRFSSFNSGILTVLINRVGDVLILLRIGLIANLGSWQFLFLNNLNWIIILIVILASFTKRAQFPFSSWLPAAIAAPTPVSSLVHSSTLVTAGVYLLIRFHYVIFKREILMNYIIITGLITILIAGFSANFEFDFKKIIAYSTLSQLGLIIIILGFKNYELAFFHLIIHAIFKSIIFICSGVVIHLILNCQDIRYMGILNKFLPLTSIIFIISNFSLCGIPFFSGFYSKDQILEIFMIEKFNLIMYFLIIFRTGLTVSYRVRLIYYLINNIFNFFPLNNIFDNKIMNLPILILFLMTLVFGFFMNWIIFSILEEVFLFLMEKLLILLICILFVIVGNKFYSLLKRYRFFIKYFFGKIWFLYYLNKIVMKFPLIIGIWYNKLVDKGWREWVLKKLVTEYRIFVRLNFLKFNINYFNNLMLLISYFVIIFIIIH